MATGEGNPRKCTDQEWAKICTYLSEQQISLSREDSRIYCGYLMEARNGVYIWVAFLADIMSVGEIAKGMS